MDVARDKRGNIINVNEFILEIISYINSYVDFKLYNNLSEPSKQKLYDKFTIMINKAFAPSRNGWMDQKTLNQYVATTIGIMNEFPPPKGYDNYVEYRYVLREILIEIIEE